MDEDGASAMISWKLYWTVGGCVVTAAGVVLAAVADVPFLLAVALLAAAVVVFLVAANRVVQHAPVFRRVSIESKQTIFGWLVAAGIAHAVWGVAFLARPDLWLLWMGGLAALGLLEYWVARYSEYLLTQVKPAAEARRAELARVEQQPEPDKPSRVLQGALELAGRDYLSVSPTCTPIKSGDRMVGYRFQVRIPARALAGRSKSATSATLDGKDVEPLAIALSERLGVDLETDWVAIVKEPAAGLYTVAVLLEDVFAQTFPYVDVPGWRSIKDPAPIGFEIDGKEYRTRLDRHWANVGASTFGKSMLEHEVGFHITLCRDAVWWVGGTEKLFDFVGEWIEPYRGTDFPLPIDAIAHGPQDTLEMIVAGFRVSRWRQSQHHKDRIGYKTIVITIEEASFLLVLNKVITKYQMRDVNPTQAAEMVTKGAASGGVYLRVVAQRGTNNNWGDCGGDINANITAQTVFHSGDQAEIGRATGDWRLPNPRHPGVFWLKPGTGKPPIMLKAGYAQQSDPNRDRLHDGATISEIAWERRRFYTALDEGSAKAAGEWYANRHTHATDELYAYLTDAVFDVPHEPSPEEVGEQVERELEARLMAAGVPLAPASGGQSSPVHGDAGVPSMVGRRPRAERILAIVGRAAPPPMSRADILDALSRDGDNADPQSVTNALAKLVTEEKLRRIDGDGGGYVAA